MTPQDLADRLEIRFENRDGAKRASHLWINAEESKTILAALRSASTREVETIAKMRHALKAAKPMLQNFSGDSPDNERVYNLVCAALAPPPSPTTLAEPEAEAEGA